MPTTAPADPDPRGDFLLATCQGGAEDLLATRLAVALPGSSRGAWRRGAVSFRLPPGSDPSPATLDRVRDDLVFARALFRCHGQIHWKDDAGRIDALRSHLPVARYDAVHHYPRDVRTMPTAELVAGAALAAERAGLGEVCPGATLGVARPGDLVLDCLADTDDRWWIGWHRATSPTTCWPGGLYPGAIPGDKVSRAWLKLDEAIASFAIDIPSGGRAVELGASPGGACQRLLEAGLEVVGIDPALVDPVVAALPGFTQWRKRARDVQLRDLRPFDWVISDMNIDPVSSMESVARVVTAPGSRVKGIIATLKLPDWSRASALDGWLGEFRSWGFRPRARQLSTGGREVCIFAARAGRRRVTAPAPGVSRRHRPSNRPATPPADR
jgi:23S rRNA (cytidine2498-2'-O)-methyltransferase